MILSAIALGFSIFNFQADEMENFFIENVSKKIFDVQYYGSDDKTDMLIDFLAAKTINFMRSILIYPRK